MEDSDEKYWIGWIGVLPRFRKMGLASQFINIIEKKVVALEAKELWVHTDRINKNAIGLYLKHGMIEWGSFKDIDAEQASANDDSIVLMKILC